MCALDPRCALRPPLGPYEPWLEEGLRAALYQDACGLLKQRFSDPELFPDDQPAHPMEKRYGGRPLTVHVI